MHKFFAPIKLPSQLFSLLSLFFPPSYRTRIAAGTDIAIAWSSDEHNPFLTKPRGENQRGAGNAVKLNERGKGGGW